MASAEQNVAKRAHFSLGQNPSAQQRAAEYAKHYRHGQAGIDVTAMKVNSRTGLRR